MRFHELRATFEDLRSQDAGRVSRKLAFCNRLTRRDSSVRTFAFGSHFRHTRLHQDRVDGLHEVIDVAAAKTDKCLS